LASRDDQSQYHRHNKGLVKPYIANDPKERYMNKGTQEMVATKEKKRNSYPT
jgi:hypothetical protein